MAKKRMDFFGALYEAARVINASLDTTHVLEEIVRTVTETMQVKACSLRLYDPRKKRLMMAAAHGLSEDYLRKGPVSVRLSGLDQRALKGETISIKDAQTDPKFQYRGMAKAEGIRSVLVVPLRIGKIIIGVMRVYTDKMRDFTTEEIKFLEAVANLSAIAIENARLHSALQRNYEIVIANKYRLDDL